MLKRTLLLFLVSAIFVVPSSCLSLRPSPLSLRVDSSVFLTGGDSYLPPMVSVPCSGPLTELIKPPSVDVLYEWYSNIRLEPDADPSWGCVWPTALSLANFLVEHGEFIVMGKTVVELGAGLGLCGLISSKLGAKSVTLTDREGFALHCALSTAAVNGLEGVVSAAILDWADDSQLVDSADVVLASDVLYDPVTTELLARACMRIGVAGGQVLVTDPVVSRYPNARDLFQKALQELGGKVHVINLPSYLCSEGETMEGRDHARRMQEPTVLIKCYLPL